MEEKALAPIDAEVARAMALAPVGAVCEHDHLFRNCDRCEYELFRAVTTAAFVRLIEVRHQALADADALAYLDVRHTVAVSLRYSFRNKDEDIQAFTQANSKYLEALDAAQPAFARAAARRAAEGGQADGK